MFKFPNFTEVKEVQPKNISVIVVTKEASKFLKSTSNKSVKFVNIPCNEYIGSDQVKVK